MSSAIRAIRVIRGQKSPFVGAMGSFTCHCGKFGDEALHRLLPCQGGMFIASSKRSGLVGCLAMTKVRVTGLIDVELDDGPVAVGARGDVLDDDIAAAGAGR